MKRQYYFTGLLAILLLSYGCSKKTTTVTKTKTTTDERDRLESWSYKDAITPKLSNAEVKRVQFYCSEEVKQERVTVNTTGTPQGGKSKSKVKEVEENQFIDLRQKGEAILIQRDNKGNIYRMLVSFDSTSQTYSLWFKRAKDGFFYLEGRAITYKGGIKYLLYADRDCHLLFDPDEEIIKVVIKRKAKGNTVQD